MRDEGNKYQVFTRRTFVLGAIQSALVLGVMGRYFYLQALERAKYRELSEQNHIKSQVIPAPRGRFIDRNGFEITNDSVIYSLGILPSKVKLASQIILKLEDALGRKLNISDQEIKRKLLNKQRNDPLILEDSLAWNDLSKISEKLPDIEGADIFNITVRNYLLADKACHITGYIGSATPKEIEANNLIPFSNIKIGKSGLERFYDATLRGEIGFKKSEVDVKGKVIKELEEIPYQKGTDLNLSIDRQLQEFVHDLMIARNISGAVVVMEAQSGEILALHSTPTFNPNQFAQGVSKKEWNEILSHSSNPLINNAISIPYPPGSTFKLITALSILRAGYDPHTKVHCSGHFPMGGHDFKCWKVEGHGPLDLYNAIAKSCNLYFYTMSLKIGIDKIAETARMLGCGDKTEIELPYEHRGLIPDETWKKARFKQSWYNGDTVNVSIGQGYVLLTPIQLATMTARLATGKIVKPSLLHNSERFFEDLAIDSKHLDVIRTGMMMSCNDPGGVIYRQNLIETGFLAGGKTGTAQVASMHLKNKNQKFHHHALFTCIAPIDNPKYVISVVAEHGQAGAKAAVPVAKQILLKLAGKRTQLDPEPSIDEPSNDGDQPQ